MLISEIFTFENLFNAHKECRKSKQHKGEIIRFEANLAFNLTTIMNDINEGKYKFGKYKVFLIYEPKERKIEVLPYKDRVVIRCLCDNLLKVRIEKKLIYDNAACRKKKGTSFAIKRLEYFLKHEYLKNKDNNIYFLKCDIKKYFPSIDHSILIKLLSKVGFSKEEMSFIKKVINLHPNNNEIGLPLGNQSSQWFALLYLNPIDRLIKEKLKIKGYIRYMDDMILIHRDKAYLQKCYKEIEKLCREELNLSLNQKTQIGKVSNGIDFLGYRHILNSNGKIIRKLRSSAKRRLYRHVKNLSKLKEKGIIDDDYVLLRQNAFYNHIKDTDESKNLKNKILSVK